MNYFTTAKLIFSMLPILIDAIKSVEDALPGVGKGEQRLALIRAVLQSTFNTGTDLQDKFDDLWPAIAKAIEVIGRVIGVIGKK